MLKLNNKISLYNLTNVSLISNIPLSRTSLYLKHLSISNISLTQTSIYHKHLSISNIPLHQTSFYLKHLQLSRTRYEQRSRIFQRTTPFLGLPLHWIARYCGSSAPRQNRSWKQAVGSHVRFSYHNVQWISAGSHYGRAYLVCGEY